MPVENNQENLNQCVCPNCPSYNACMRGKVEKLYCAKEKSHCEVPMNGCVCGNCPVYFANNLGEGYYCLSGKASQNE